MIKALRFIFLILVFSLTSCFHSSNKKLDKISSNAVNLMHYAQNIAVYTAPQGYYVDVINPWDTTKMLGQFVFLPDSVELSFDLQGRSLVRTPIESVVALSSTQWSMFLKLNEISSVKAISESAYTHNAIIKKMINEASMIDVGYESNYDVEKLIRLNPQIILYSPYFEADNKHLQISGATLFPFSDYLENNPLGRAEWLKIVGLMCGRETEALTLFSEIENRYLQMKSKCAQVENRPTVFSDKAFNGQWYVAGGKSYLAQLFADAGADYVWKDNTSTASFPLDSETILFKAHDADFWRISNSSLQPCTYASLARENQLYTNFDAYKKRQILICDVIPTAYFEQSQLEPDVLLSDFIFWFHPELFTDSGASYQPKYYHILDE